jgi:hypothetical protein
VLRWGTTWGRRGSPRGWWCREGCGVGDSRRVAIFVCGLFVYVAGFCFCDAVVPRRGLPASASPDTVPFCSEQ